MKKIYFTLLAGFFLAHTSHGQLTLQQSTHEPAVGDISSTIEYDSTGTVPRSTGVNQTWNFSSFSQTTLSASASTFVTASSVPAASLFVGANLAENQGSGNYIFYKSTSTPTKLEVLGFYDPTLNFVYSNAMTQAIWPISYATTFTDNFAGTISGSGFSANMIGTLSAMGSGSGILILPGGASYSNILQLKLNLTQTMSITVPIATTQVISSVSYIYFHASNKFPLLSVSYDEDGFANIGVNKLVAVGLTDYNFDATYAIYPNPAKDNFYVKLSNAANEECRIEIYNSIGQAVKTIDLGGASGIEESISINGLSSGIYIVKTSLGQKSSTRRLIVE